jgi:alpha-D-ribose 1-methylphosphonate 5-triphosphate diphosphatase
MPSRRLLTNATLVLPDRLLSGAALLIDGEQIAEIGPAEALEGRQGAGGERCDLGGAHVLPGLVDLHTDTLEKEITPRPAADFPIDVAVHELDRKLVACGITTVFHSLHFGYQEAEWSNRSRYTRRDVVAGVRALASGHLLARTHVHLRYEVVGNGPASLGLVKEMLDARNVELLSFMDHTPGQGQYTRERFLAQRLREGMTPEQAEAVLTEKRSRPRLSAAEMREVADLARERGIPIASHDDDTVEKVDEMRALGVSICEFPITLEAARHANRSGLCVLGGASNVLRGGSLTGNLNVRDAIAGGAVAGLCSDYYPPAMLHAVFKLAREEVLPLWAAVATATRIPAEAAGLSGIGALIPGRGADLIVVRLRGETPVVEQTFVRGERVHAAGRERLGAQAA